MNPVQASCPANYRTYIRVWVTATLGIYVVMPLLLLPVLLSLVLVLLLLVVLVVLVVLLLLLLLVPYAAQP